MMALALKFCNKPIPYKPVEIKQEVKTRDSLLDIINNFDKKKDSINTKIAFYDSVSNFYINKYRKLKQSIKKEPCDTSLKKIVVICDSIIVKDSTETASLKYKCKQDSSEIVSLKSVIRQDSIIQAKQSDKIVNDSTTIHKLNKRLKAQKLITKLGFFGGLVGGAAFGYKLN